MSLPKGWAYATLEQVADTVLGKMLDAAKNKGELVPYLRNVNVRWGSFDLGDLNEMRVTDDELAALSVRDGDLFVCEGGEPGRSAIWRGGNQKIVFQKALHRLRTKAGIEPDFVAKHLVSVAKERSFSDLLTGTTIKHLTQVSLKKVQLPLPPSAEQRRIVAKLDALTARITRARAELDRVPRLTRHFREQALARCFAVAGFPEIALGDEIQAIESGKNLRCEERPPQDGEKGVVKVSAVTWGRFDATKSKTLPSDFVPPEKSRIKVGDLLISRANTLELVGAPVIVEEQPRDLFLSDKILRLVVAGKAKRWVLWFLRSPNGRRQIESMATGNQLSMRNISQDALRKIRLPFPEENIRMERIQLLEHAFARADRLEAEAARARKLLDRLESVILAKAFRGELVPQDPNDEPASVLLERIRAERAAAPKQKRRRKSEA
jgi:type I restriction enzyme S subunit